MGGLPEPLTLGDGLSPPRLRFPLWKMGLMLPPRWLIGSLKWVGELGLQPSQESGGSTRLDRRRPAGTGGQDVSLRENPRRMKPAPPARRAASRITGSLLSTVPRVAGGAMHFCHRAPCCRNGRRLPTGSQCRSGGCGREVACPQDLRDLGQRLSSPRRGPGSRGGALTLRALGAQRAGPRERGWRRTLPYVLGLSLGTGDFYGITFGIEAYFIKCKY